MISLVYDLFRSGNTGNRCILHPKAVNEIHININTSSSSKKKTKMPLSIGRDKEKNVKKGNEKLKGKP